jgi:rubredoxin
MNSKKEEKGRVEVEALCPECGLAFKRYVDRVVGENKKSDLAEKVECPVCGCGECDIIKPGT